MSLKLYLHPLSSYCHKALIAFYENDIPFEAKRIDDAGIGAEFRRLWPIGRFPLLRDDSRDATVPESSIIIEYLALHYPGRTQLVPADPDLARKVRMRDRFFDNYMHTPMQKFAFDRLRPEDKRDAHGVEEAKAMYRTALDMVEKAMAGSTWVMGEEFTMADCAAAPPLLRKPILRVVPIDPQKHCGVSRSPHGAPLICARFEASRAVHASAAEVTVPTEVNMRSYFLVSGVLFSVIAVVQALRLARGWTAVIAGWDVPMAFSMIAVAVTAGLAIWAFRLLGAKRA